MKKNIFRLTLAAAIAALAFVFTFVSIPLGTAKVHLGNFICVISSLLFGGFIGGISSAVGMLLNDIAGGYPWDSQLRTFISKLVLGLVVGILYQVLIKKTKIKPMISMVLASLTGILFGIGTEIVLRLITKTIINNNFDVAKADVISHLPSNFITGGVTLALAIVIYPLVYKGIE